MPFWHPGSATGDSAAPALVAGTDTLSHADLADRVRQEARAWPGAGERRLVLLEIEPTLDSVVTYLAAVEAGHVVLLSAPGRADSLVDAWAPDDRAARVDGAWAVSHGTAHGRHDLHPDLQLLLSTSGSTGSPKLVRLSADAVRANALDIAAALGLAASDRAVSTLPLHYCYGLSVLHSHLAVGGSVLLTDASVTDPALWSAVRAARGDLAGRGAAHLRAAGVERRAHRQRADPAPGHPGRGPARPGAGAGLGGARSPRGLGPARHVRPDRGHRADGGHRAGRGGAGPGIRGSAVGAGRFSVRDAGGDVPAGRGGRPVLHRAERDARLRAGPRRPGARPRGHRPPDRRPGPAARRRDAGGRRAARVVPEGQRHPPGRRAGRAAAGRRGAHRPGGWDRRAAARGGRGRRPPHGTLRDGAAGGRDPGRVDRPARPPHRGGAGAGAAATPQRQARPVGGRLDRRPAHDDGSHAAAGVLDHGARGAVRRAAGPARRHRGLDLRRPRR